MRKKNLLGLFLKEFSKSLFMILILFGVGFGSYKLTMHFYKPDSTQDNSKAKEIISEIANDVPVEKISKNLIAAIDSKTGRLCGIVLELFNTYTCNVDYITIPANTQLTLSNELYLKMNEINQDVPQILMLSDLNQYFTGEEGIRQELLIFEELLGVEVPYYSVMKETDFSRMFEEEQQTFAYRIQEGKAAGGEERVMTVMTQKLSSDFMGRAGKIKDEAALAAFIGEWYEEIDTNLTEKNKLKYIADYMQVNPDLIHYHCLYGREENGCFLVMQEESTRLLKELEGNLVKYQEAQQNDLEALGRVSEGLSIRISNGSGITGLASAYRDILAADNYEVSGIANYTQNDLEKTRIVVRKEGTGGDLLKFFKDAELETGQLEEGTDIEIILGRNDRR